MEENEGRYSMIEEREELMVPPSNNNNINQPTLRKAHFLKPLLNPNKIQSFPKFIPPKQPLNPNLTNKNVKFKAMLRPLNSWETWVFNLQQTHEKIWKKAGIFEAIKASTYHIIKEDKIIMALAEKWCCETNTFVFDWGECTVTLEDVMILGGFSVLGNCARNEFSITEDCEMVKKLVEIRREIIKRYNFASHNQWMEFFKGSGGELEHVAFLVLWLLRHVFPPNTLCKHNVIYCHVFSTAIRLSRGTRIAFAPAMLSMLYRDLRLLKEKIVEGKNDGTMLVVSAPFQIVQVWAWERFSGLRPKPCLLVYGEPRLARWHEVKQLNSEDSRVEIESAGEDFLWRPYALELHNWVFPRFYCNQEKWVLVDSEDEHMLSFAKCLMACDLVGVDCVERYRPQRVAMQFGLDQDIPFDVSELAADSYDKSLDGLKLYLPFRLCEGDVSLRYSEWLKAPLSVIDHVCKKQRRRKRKTKKLSEIIDQDDKRNGKADGLLTLGSEGEEPNDNLPHCKANEPEEDVAMNRQEVVVQDAVQTKESVTEEEEDGEMNYDNENMDQGSKSQARTDSVWSGSDMLVELSPSCEITASHNVSLSNSGAGPTEGGVNFVSIGIEEDDDNVVAEREDVMNISDEEGNNGVAEAFKEHVSDEEDNNGIVEAFNEQFRAIDDRISRLERMTSLLKWKASKMRSDEA